MADQPTGSQASHSSGGRPSSPAARRTGATGVWPALGWAGYLAGSWTWVIGLLWPALLVRDFGLWGWLAFAVPNVVGAAAFGFVLGRPGLSRWVVSRHPAVAVRFSEVTIAFHVFAGGWVLWALAGMSGVAAGAAVALAVWMVGFERGRALPAVGLAAITASAGLAVLWVMGAAEQAGISWTTANTGPGTQQPVSALAWLAPALTVGFVLSPYLDLTFHRARQATAPATGKLAFTLGFGVFFLAMLVFSLTYAVQMEMVFAQGRAPAPVPNWARWTLVAHIALQAGLTTGFHLHEVAERRGHAGLHRVLALAVAGGALAYWAIQWFAAFQGPTRPGPAIFALNPAEGVYRCFILFYGLVFPAYVWLVIWPTRRPVATRIKILIWLATLLVTAPVSVFAFVDERYWLIGPTLLVLLLARGVVAAWPARSTNAA